MILSSLGGALEGPVFSRVIVDKAQCLRNMSSGVRRMTRLLAVYACALHLLSATPVLSCVDDIWSLATLC
jgi:hypothetical protein